MTIRVHADASNSFTRHFLLQYLGGIGAQIPTLR